MINSFRIRLTLFSVLLSGIVLAVFASSAWVLIYRSKQDALHREIRDRGVVVLSRYHHEARGPFGFEKDGRLFFADEDDADEFIMLVRDADGNTVYASENWPDDIFSSDIPEPDKPFLEYRPPPPRGEGRGPRGEGGLGDRPPPMRDMAPPRPDSDPVYAALSSSQGRWITGVMKSDQITVALAVNTSEIREVMSGVTRSMLIALPAGLFLIGLGGWWLAGTATRPVRRLAKAAEKITAHGLDTRISSNGEAAEFKRLIVIFNQMLERLERSFQQALRFSSDAAHELKTPLTVLQQQLEQALQRAKNESAEQQTYASLVEEVQRLKSITQKLLVLSQADAGELKLNAASFDFSVTVENAAEDIGILAPELTVNTAVEPGVCVNGDRELLTQVLQNLINNAIKYNRESGRIDVALERAREKVVLRVANTGPCIAEGDRDRIFERFYRADKSRSREVQGHGLGLSLAREIARAHGGELSLVRSDEQETVFELSLPLPANSEPNT